MRTKRFVSLLAAVSAVTLLSSACGAGGGTSDTSGPIKIGFFEPQTGFGAPDGRSALAGAQLAVQEINADHGIDGRKVQLVTYDDGSDPKQGAVIATKLTTQDHVVAAVSGSYSPQTLAAAALFQRAKIPMMSAYAVNPGIPQTGDYIFQQDFNGVVQGRAGAKILYDEGSRKPAIISIDNDFGNALVQGFQDEAKKLGMSVVSSDKNQFGEKNFDTIIRRALSRGADSVYMVQYVAEGKQFLLAWQRSGSHIPVLSTEGIDSAGFLDSIGHLADGMKFTTNLNRDSSSTATRQFLTDFDKAENFSADMVAASSHDAVMLIAQAMKDKGTSPADIQAGLAGLKNFEGATGTVTHFTADGEVVKPVQVQVFKDGAVHSAGVVNDPSIVTP
ncbi:MAG TPA: ABC transporter substrate-binding protein [Marmoricola sp.]|nr:ABC transporter substrate-binding protein [Marmoricola sp.]